MEIIQITDLHITKDIENIKNNCKPYFTLSNTLKHIEEHYPQVKDIVITGDLSNDYSQESYVVIKDLLKIYKFDIFILPGNHDNIDSIQAICDDQISTDSIDLRPFNILAYNFDTHVPGKIYGHLKRKQIDELKNKLNDLDFNGRLFKISYGTTPPPINLHIQSNGGSLMNALYIVDLIDNLETPVNTYVDGYAASAASLISVMGKERYMTKNSMILIHQLSSGREGKYEELHDDNENLIMLMDKLKTIYMEHSHISEEILDNILKHDLWLDAERCKQYGLIDKII